MDEINQIIKQSKFVYQNIKPPKLVPHEISQGSNTCLVQNIELMENDVGKTQSMEISSGLFTSVLVPGCQNHRHTLRRELLHRLQTDALVSPRNHRDSAKLPSQSGISIQLVLLLVNSSCRFKANLFSPLQAISVEPK